MQEFIEVTRENIRTLADVMNTLEQAASVHADDLQIDFSRMLSDFGALWMIVKSRIVLRRIPGTLRVRTWLRTPSSAVSNRDFALFEGSEEIGYAVQSWALVDAKQRTILNMRKIPPLWKLPTPQPERTDALKRLSAPPMCEVERWRIEPQELDRNGHLNNTQYIRHAEAYAPEGASCLDVVFERECFAGETLILQAADGFVQGRKEDGTTSFLAHFYQKGESI